MIARMERIEIVCLRDGLPEMVVFLQEQGVLHIEEVPLAVERHPGYLHRVHLREEQKVEVEGLEELERMLAEITPLLPVQPSPEKVGAAAEGLEGESIESWRRKVRGWSRELRSMARRKANVKDNIEILRNHYEMLAGIEPIVGPDVVLGEDARAFVVRAESTQLVPRLRKRLVEQIGPEVRLVHREAAKHTLVGAVTYPKAHDDRVREVLHEEGIAPVEVPDKALRGQPLGEVLRGAGDRIAQQQERLGELEAELERFSAELGADLAALKAIVADRLAQLRVVSRFAQSEMVAVIHGWMPRAGLPAFEQGLSEGFGGRAMLNRLSTRHIEQKRIPILLQNHPWFEPFEILLSLFKPPRYGTMDPSALVGVFFVLFYGFILGDAVYGAVVLLLSFLLRRRWGTIRAVRAASTVGLYAGVSAIVFGVLYGEYCGDLGTRLFGLQPVWFHRGHDTLRLLKIAVYIGAGHMVLSLLLGIWANWRLGQTKVAMERLGMLMGLVGVGLFVAGVTGIGPGRTVVYYGLSGALLVGAAALMFVFTGWFATIHLLEIISLAGNVMSYSRLMALGIASVALADVANRLGGMVESPFVGIPIALLIHLVNVALGMFSPTLHSLRLNYVEFLPKFYVPEGREYEPFKKEAIC